MMILYGVCTSKHQFALFGVLACSLQKKRKLVVWLVFEKGTMLKEWQRKKNQFLAFVCCGGKVAEIDTH